ncbi:MAG: S8 family peptidase [Burkholderiaceae bacterium]|nr:S8 family peptidase [Burkholderiaceae bacterium]
MHAWYGLAALAAALHSTATWAMPQELPARGVIVQLRASAVAHSTAAAHTPRETPLAVREQAHSAWQQRHRRQADRVRQVALDAGVALDALGSAGTAFKLELADPASGAQWQAAVQRLQAHPDVLSVTPNVRWQRAQTAVRTPNDPLFAQQWHLHSPQVQPAALNMPVAWATHTGSSAPVVVAVLDGGVRFDHPDLAGRLLPGYDFVSEVDFANDGDGRDSDASDPGDWISARDSRSSPFRESLCEVSNSSWHGTAIAGQIAATTNNGLGVAGVSWGAQVLPVRVAGKCGATLSDLLDGMRWAAGLPVAGVPLNPHPARVINLSYGGSGACDGAYQQAVDDVTAAGALVVVAGGNAAAPLTRPADCTGVVAVAALRGDGAKAAYASYGGNIGASVPGGSGISGAPDAGLLTTSNTGLTTPASATYTPMTGSSFASPLVAGVASLMLSARPELTPRDLRLLLTQGQAVRPHTWQATLPTCSPLVPTQGACNCTTTTCGPGVLDAAGAVAQAISATLLPATNPDSTTPSGQGDSDSATGGGGATGWPWGLALWGWLAALAIGRHRGRGRSH